MEILKLLELLRTPGLTENELEVILDKLGDHVWDGLYVDNRSYFDEEVDPISHRTNPITAPENKSTGLTGQDAKPKDLRTEAFLVIEEEKFDP